MMNRLVATGLVMASVFMSVTAKAPPSTATIFAAISDWGGTDSPPYTTKGQLAAAKAMDEVRPARVAHGILF